MSKVTIRDLRNHGADVIARANRGETMIVTRAGKPVAQLRPLDRAPLSAAEVVARWKHLPTLDGHKLRAEIDATLDAAP